MNRAFAAVLLIILFLSTAVTAEEVRHIRKSGVETDGMNDMLDGYDDWKLRIGSMVELEDDEFPALIWTLPNFNSSFEDKWYNVRFSPPDTGYFRIIRVLIPLLGLADDDGNWTIGSPGMKVLFWTSDSQGRESGYPGELITSIDIEPDDLVFSGERADEWVLNVINVEAVEEISFNDSTDFHIGIELISDSEEDTLAIISDEADLFDNSSFYNVDEEYWMKTNLVGLNDGVGNIIRVNFNYGIWCVVTPLHSVDGEREEILLGPPLPSDKNITFHKAYPNPFNSRLYVNFSVRKGVPFDAGLYDLSGRFISAVGSGMGSANINYNVQVGNMNSGVYFLKINAGGEVKTHSLMYLP